MQYGFGTLTDDFFQPEQIFQLDQPVRPSDMNFPTEPDKSPTTVLDLGSGTIQRSSFKIEPQDQIWEFNSSPIKQEENSNSVDEHFLSEDYNGQICFVSPNHEFANNFYKTDDSSCRYQYAGHQQQPPKPISNESQNIPNYSHHVDHICAENRLSCEHASYSGYSNDIHFDEKFNENVYNHCDPFPDIDISQLDYSAKSVYSNVSSLDNSAIMEEESVFNEFTPPKQELNSHSCYSQPNFQNYMFSPQH